MVLHLCGGVARDVVCVEVDMASEWMVMSCAVNVGWKRWREDVRCELQAHEEGGEAGKGDHMGEGIGAPGARYVGEHVVVRTLGGDGPLFVAADFLGPTCGIKLIII